LSNHQDKEYNMPDDILYIQASNELNAVAGAQRDDATWTEALDLAAGDQELARYKYMNLRVGHLAAEGSAVKTVPSPGTARSGILNNPDYISLAKFSAKNTVSEKHILQNIRDGYYQGKKVAGTWYIFVGKNKYDTFEEKKETFFLNTANEITESGQPETDPHDSNKVVPLAKKK
jgi:hypothetical protein